MSGLVILLMGLAVGVTGNPVGSPRIIGGAITDISRYPFMVSLLYSSGDTGHQQQCSGFIVGSLAILTVAHCTVGDHPARWRSRVGSTNANSGGTVYNTFQILIHPQYNRFYLDNDIAIIRPSSVISFNNNVRSISIGGADYNPADNQPIWSAGWGVYINPAVNPNAQKSEQLRHMQTWVVNLITCRQRYAAISRLVTDNMVCSGSINVGDRDHCTGDGGSPLLHNGVAFGIYSFGPPGRCGDPSLPSVNTRLSRYSTWIANNA